MMTAELFEPGEYLNQDLPGYFSILASKHHEEKAFQNTYPIEHLHTVVNGLNPQYNTWISQASFKAKNRRAVNVNSIGLCFVDLDTYNIETMRSQDPEQQVKILLTFCRMEGIPAPSLVIFSGRGLQAKWLLSNAIGADRVIDWNSIQGELVNRLHDLGSDVRAKDVSRVLRLDQTVNTKSGERCRVVYTHSGIEGLPTRYDFDELFETFGKEQKSLNRPSNLVSIDSSRIISIGDKTNIQRLNWYRLYDIRDLIQMRGGEVQEGSREVSLFWMLNFLLLANPISTGEIWKEAQALASEVNNQPGWYRNSDLTTVYNKAKAMLAGEGVAYKGKVYPALYTPKNQYLIETFRIESDEMQFLRTIIDKDEKNRRLREKRWSEGVQPRTLYGPEKPWDILGISRRSYFYNKERYDQAIQEAKKEQEGTKSKDKEHSVQLSQGGEDVRT